MRLITILVLLISVNAFGQTKGALENPSQGSYTSGIYMFSGWACDAELIEIVVDGGSGLKAAYGTSRGDTRGICGDSDNGFGLLYNMANLGTGEHTAVAFADGQEIGRSTFSVKRMTSGEFLRDAEAQTVVKNFPSAGQEAVLTWVQSAQNFLISDEYESPNPYDVAGIWTEGEALAISINTRVNPNDKLTVLASGFLEESTGGVTKNYLMVGLMQAGALVLTTMDEYHPDITIEVGVTFDSAEAGTVELLSCTPSSYCFGPVGSTFPIFKIF